VLANVAETFRADVTRLTDETATQATDARAL
jgi:hypothetical protein